MATAESVSFELAPTVDEIIRLCDEAWAYARQLRAEANDDISAIGVSMVHSEDHSLDTLDAETRAKIEDSIYEKMADRFQDLNKAYPIVVVVMASGFYKRSIVRKFFTYVREHPWRNEEEFFTVQSVYSSMVYQEQHKRSHPSGSELGAVRERTRTALMDHRDQMKQYVERIKRTAEYNNRMRAEERKRQLAAQLERARAILVEREKKPIVVQVEGLDD